MFCRFFISVVGSITYFTLCERANLPSRYPYIKSTGPYLLTSPAFNKASKLMVSSLVTYLDIFGPATFLVLIVLSGKIVWLHGFRASLALWNALIRGTDGNRWQTHLMIKQGDLRESERVQRSERICAQERLHKRYRDGFQVALLSLAPVIPRAMASNLLAMAPNLKSKKHRPRFFRDCHPQRNLEVMADQCHELPDSSRLATKLSFRNQANVRFFFVMRSKCTLAKVAGVRAAGKLCMMSPSAETSFKRLILHQMVHLAPSACVM